MRKRYRLALLIAAVAVAARLPFLITGKIAFDSDEAVEGLMARHVLNGELTAFFWGQAFKGVPEVYANAAAFALLGPSVLVLKSVTLVLFAAYVALNFVLLDRIAGRWISWTASLLLISSPPALVFWSLDASAEYVVLMLAGTGMLLLCTTRAESREQRAESGEQIREQRAEGGERRAESDQLSARRLAAIGLLVGGAIWVHQLFIIYLLPLAIVLVCRSRTRIGMDTWRRAGAVSLAFGILSAVYLGLAVIAFVTGGFSIAIGSMTLGARAPQKLLRIGLGIAALGLLAQGWQDATPSARRRGFSRVWPFGAGFLAGYSPVILYSILVEPARSPLRSANIWQLKDASADIFGNVVPILAGFKLATTERMPLPLAAAIPGVAALLAYVWSHRRRLADLARLRAQTATIAEDFFPLFVVLTPLLFLIGGAYLDTQSYRYLIPLYAGLSVAWAAGSLRLAGGNRALASVLVGGIIAVHAWQQIVWYDKLRPDTTSPATIDCLRREGILGGYADYWTSYKLTFLSDETIIIAPENGVDRYPKYTEFVRSLPADKQVRLGAPGTKCSSPVP